MIEVLHPGAMTTLQDLGRSGLAHMGVSSSGAADSRSLRLANRLVGNPEGMAALETTITGPRLRFLRHATIALTGAPCEATVDGRPVGFDAPQYIRPMEVLDVGSSWSGTRTYLAVRGGIDAPVVLGSRARDILSELGPPPLAAGDVLRLLPPVQPMPGVDIAPTRALDREPRLRIVFGPRDHWFTDESRRLLTSHPYVVTDSCNRVGARLLGPPLERKDDTELLSEGMIAGALEVPPAGQPILLLADHPTTGGYPVIAVVVSADLPRAGQLRPGQRVRFDAGVQHL